MLKLFRAFAIATSLVSLGTAAAAPHALIQIARASDASMQAAKNSKELAARLKHDADDPYQDANTARYISQMHMVDEMYLEQAFAADMENAFHQLAKATEVPNEYASLGAATPDGWRITQYLANAVLRAHLPCNSIYAWSATIRFAGNCRQG